MSETEKPQKDIDEKLEELGNHWHQVYISYFPTQEKAFVRNDRPDVHTDSVKEVSGPSLNSALNKALKQAWENE